jgi:protease-4
VFSEYGISNGAYFLISMADEIYIPEMTDVGLKGLSVNISFYRGLLDTLSIVPEVFRVNYDGKSYKTAGDQLLNREMSDEMRENYSELFEDLYTVFVNGISEGRGWDAEHTKEVINNGPYLITQDAIDAGLVTSTMYPDEFEEYIDELNDEKVTITKWKDIDRSDDYVHEWAPKEKDKIAVIYAVGGIQSGKSNPGPAGSSVMGDKTIMKAIKSAREDKSIKAIVLRIDSGGGSALASDHMWSEVLKTTTTDTSNVKPFIASMSDVAASGGYYIACEADSILADEATITGSIGVIGLRLNFSQFKKNIGINQQSLTFGENSNFMSSARLINDDEYERLQATIDDVYTRFKTRVIEGRHNLTEDDDLDDVALGRVFTGKRASELKLKLVDKLGGLHEAIEVAKKSANIEGDVHIVEYPRKEKSKKALKIILGMELEQQITDLLPESIRSDWEYLRSMEGLMDENTLMILPYKINIE